HRFPPHVAPDFSPASCCPRRGTEVPRYVRTPRGEGAPSRPAGAMITRQVRTSKPEVRSYTLSFMRAIRFHEHGGPEVLRYEDAPDPTAPPGWALVRVRACAM